MTPEQQGRMIEVLGKYEDVFAREPNQLRRMSVVQHEIQTEESPLVKQRFYPTSKLEHEFIGQEIKRMEEAGLIRPLCSLWVSSVMLVKKKNGKIRMCIDFRKLNQQTK
ncbi:6023_t:CDS:1, partial [Ambispora leptoticha]